MDKKEYLNEEWYQKTKKRITKISLIILIASIVIGCGLISAGFLLSKNSTEEADKLNKKNYEAAKKESQSRVDKANERIEEIKKEIEPLKQKYNAKAQECDSLNKMDPNWFANVNQCNREASDINSQIAKLKNEQFQLENGNYTVYYDLKKPKDYTYLCFIGGGVIGLGIVLAIIFYFIAKGREIKAYRIQQNMPINQEAIEKITPTVANATGEVAKKMTSSIKEGIAETQVSEEQSQNTESKEETQKKDNNQA